MGLATKDNGSMVGETVQGFRNGQMGKSMKVNGITVELMDLEG